jgi:hypothetical protein
MSATNEAASRWTSILMLSRYSLDTRDDLCFHSYRLSTSGPRHP